MLDSMDGSVSDGSHVRHEWLRQGTPGPLEQGPAGPSGNEQQLKAVVAFLPAAHAVADQGSSTLLFASHGVAGNEYGCLLALCQSQGHAGTAKHQLQNNLGISRMRPSLLYPVQSS